MRAAIDIAIKDLRQRIRDRSALLIGIVAPFVLAAIFSMILGGGSGFHAVWTIVDLDEGDIANALVDGPIASMDQAGILTVTSSADVAEARAAVERGEVHTAIVIPAGFSEAVRGGDGASLELIADPDASISAQVARSVLAGFSSDVEAVGLSVATALAIAGQPPDAAEPSRLSQVARALPNPVVVADDQAADRTAPISTYYAAAMAIMFVFLGAQFGVTSLLAERRHATLSRMVAAPIRPASILAGKTMVSLVIASVSMTVIVVGTAVLLGARWGDPVAVALLIGAAALAATGVALLVVGFAKTEDQAGVAVAIVTITLAILGGSFFPVAQGTGVLAQLSLLTPHHWFLDGVANVATGGDASTAAGAITVLTTLGLVSGAVGLWRARRVVVP